MDERLVANTSRFPHETIDGETLLIDADTGHLLLLAGFASVLWGHLVNGTTIEGLGGAVDARFGAEAGAITRNFLSELRDAQLVVPATGAVPPAAAMPAWPDRFTAPLLERYDDIAKIIAMDPIHDVDTSVGWPRPAGNRKA